MWLTVEEYDALLKTRGGELTINQHNLRLEIYGRTLRSMLSSVEKERTSDDSSGSPGTRQKANGPPGGHTHTCLV